eukprot:SAG11_NODE_33420_length_277_cov_0.910112_1_plen_34_part_01
MAGSIDIIDSEAEVLIFHHSRRLALMLMMSATLC